MEQNKLQKSMNLLFENLNYRLQYFYKLITIFVYSMKISWIIQYFIKVLFCKYCSYG